MHVVITIHPAVFTAGAVVMAAAWTPWILLIGRIIVGFGIGIAAMAVPMYIAELAPADMRGRLVVVNNMFITGGQFIATVIDGAFSYLGINVGWRSVKLSNFCLVLFPDPTLKEGKWCVIHTQCTSSDFWGAEDVACHVIGMTIHQPLSHACSIWR